MAAKTATEVRKQGLERRGTAKRLLKGDGREGVSCWIDMIHGCQGFSCWLLVLEMGAESCWSECNSLQSLLIFSPPVSLPTRLWWLLSVFFSSSV